MTATPPPPRIHTPLAVAARRRHPKLPDSPGRRPARPITFDSAL